MKTLSGRDLQRLKTWRRDDGDLKTISPEGRLEPLRVFIRWCGSIATVEQDLHEKSEALMPRLSRNDEQSEVIPDAEQAEVLLDYQCRFEYACRAHVITEILPHTGVQLGGLHSLNVEDFDEENQRLKFTHRPDEETPLKNGQEGECMIALSAEVCRVIEDWRDPHRHDVKDEYGRESLLPSRNGRMNRTRIRDAIY